MYAVDKHEAEDFSSLRSLEMTIFILNEAITASTSNGSGRSSAVDMHEAEDFSSLRSLEMTIFYF